METQIAVTLFNLREFCKTAEDLDQTLGKLVKIGYGAVQVSAVSLPPEVIREKLDRHGLICCATHESFDDIKNNIEKLANKLDTLGCKYAALGAAPLDMRTPEGYAELAKLFNERGAYLKSRGIQLGYHNHQFEFDHCGTDKTMLEYFYELTDPELVCAELDVHWTTRGGGNPAQWLKRYKGRVPVIHVKDFTIIGSDPVFCEIGTGNLDWKGIFAAAAESGVRWFSIEQDQPFKDRDLFESMKISFDNMRKMGIK